MLLSDCSFVGVVTFLGFSTNRGHLVSCFGFATILGFPLLEVLLSLVPFFQDLRISFLPLVSLALEPVSFLVHVISASVAPAHINAPAPHQIAHHIQVHTTLETFSSHCLRNPPCVCPVRL